MDDVRRNAQERAARPSTLPVGSSFESERQKQKAALVRQIDELDGSKIRKISAATERTDSQKTLRVAAYCRVSTDDIDQAISIELQMRQYKEKIKSNPDWKYAGTYVDNGFSGTNTAHRPGFLKLIEDARAGKIDMIITKAVSRFARNLLDCISYIDELKNLDPPVRVFFEQENLDTGLQTSGIILFVLAMVAEEESHMKSEAMLLSLEWRFSRGRFLTPSLFGYDKIEIPDSYGGKRKMLQINEQQAQVVKWMYARVSNGKDAMLHSLSAQVSYYNELIQSNPEWLFCGIYADEALTGTKSNRAEFQKMLTACRNGEIDLVITKSISRFARNTVTLLETVRELKDIGVDVYFEEQNIHTMSADGELMLTILSSYAQEESFSASENKKWQIRKDFEQGRVSSMRMLGYRRTPNGSLEIISEEAVIVRRIFSEYISGIGKMKIANVLNEENIPTINGCEWTTEDIRRILQNEKYAGNMLLQKAYRENHITKKCLKNKGELPQFYVEESHPAIIEPQIFDLVQGLIKTRSRHFTPPKSTVAVYPFTGKILCGCCGKNYRRKTTATGVVWICSTYNTKGKKYCPTTKQIPEEKLYATCCDTLEISDFDEDIFQSEIQQIIVPAPNQLEFIFHNGTTKTVEWQDRSRSESWTDEMRKQAGRISKERRWHKCP